MPTQAQDVPNALAPEGGFFGLVLITQVPLRGILGGKYMLLPFFLPRLLDLFLKPLVAGAEDHGGLFPS